MSLKVFCSPVSQTPRRLELHFGTSASISEGSAWGVSVSKFGDGTLAKQPQTERFDSELQRSATTQDPWMLKNPSHPESLNPEALHPISPKLL